VCPQPFSTRATARCRSASLAANRSASGSGYPASIKTCKRQLSTFERSLAGATSIVSVVSLTLRLLFVVVKTNPARVCWPSRASANSSRPERRELVDPSDQLLQTRFDHRAFGVCIGRNITEPTSQFVFGVAKAYSERLHEFVALPVER
jgi:hypothetical protein